MKSESNIQEEKEKNSIVRRNTSKTNSVLGT